MDVSTLIGTYERRAGRWALQTSTIIGAATIVAAAIGGTADATTGLPVVSALIGLVAGGLAAIFLPGQDAAPLIAGIEQIAAAVTRRDASDAKTVATAAIAAVVTKPEGIAAAVAGAATAATDLREAVAAAA